MLPPVSYLAQPDEPSRLARYFFYCTLLLILLVSFYPFNEWRMPIAPLFDFYFYPLPHYYTIFDNTINVFAYIPLGYCLTMMLPQRWISWLLALLVGVLVSGTVEFIQQFIPSRVASNLDILSNGAGTLLGAWMAVILGNRRLQRILQAWRRETLPRGSLAEWGFAWLLLWFVSQFDPVQPFLGVVVMPHGLPQAFESPIENAEFFLRLLEGGGMMLNLLGVSLYVSLLCRLNAQVPQRIAITLALALLAKMLFAGMLLKPAQFFAWININIVVGGIMGGLLLLLLWRLHRRLRALLGFLALLAAQVVSEYWPLTARFSDDLSLFRWRYGHLEHFSGLATMIGDLWPLGAALWLLIKVLRPSQEGKWHHDSQLSRY